MWKCRCGTENRTAGRRCYYCRRLKDADVETLPLVLGCIAFLIAFPAAMIGGVYQIPALEHYGAIALLLFIGFFALSMARADQTRGVSTVGTDVQSIDILEKESPFLFWLYTVTMYAGGILLIVYAVISFLFPSILSPGH